MKICVMTSCHRVDDIRVFYKECVTAAAAGHEVTLVVPHQKDEVRQGIRIRSVPIPRSRLGRMTTTACSILRVALQENADWYHFHDPELLTVASALKLWGKRVIYDVHEDLPRHMVAKDWLPEIVRGPMGFGAEKLEGVAALFLDAIVAATPSIAARFPANRTFLVRNFPLLREFFEETEVAEQRRGPFAVYVGGITEIRGAREMIEAIGHLDPTLGVKLRLAGQFDSPALREQLALLEGWKRVEYQGWLDRVGVRNLLQTSSVGLVLSHPLPNHLESLPIKMFEYMAAGLPVIASDFSVFRQIVEGAGCGFLVDPQDVGKVAEAVDWMFRHPLEAAEMGRRGRAAVRDRYNWEAEATTLLRVYEGSSH